MTACRLHPRGCRFPTPLLPFFTSPCPCVLSSSNANDFFHGRSRETTSKDFSISNDSVTDTSSLAPTETAIVRSVSHNESRRTSERGVLTPPRAASVAQSNTGDGTNDSRPRPRYIRGRKGPVDSIWSVLSMSICSTHGGDIPRRTSGFLWLGNARRPTLTNARYER